MMSNFDSTLASLGIARTNTAPTASKSNAASQTLGQGDFLKLMTAQMQNQDPFNPVDNTQMVAQMAQFSSVAGISEMGTTLKAIAEKLGATSASDAMAYIGKSVMVPGNTAFARTGGGIAGGLELDGDADAVKVAITDADGQVLKTLDLGKQAKGTVNFDWDGKTDAGADAGAGPFKLSLYAQADGKAVSGKTLVWAPVQSVSTTSGAAVLTLPGLGQIPATQIRQIG